jgi:uncharacterized membrane protein
MINFLLNHSPLLYFTQSLWRDEAFSVLVAERPISFLVTKLGFEPPVYYILLHMWMKIFGNSEIAVRSLSLLAMVIATIVVIGWAEKLYKRHFLSWYLPVFFFLNPMLLYYAFEVRTYAWMVLFTVLSLYYYTEKRWNHFALSTILGFYTHSYFIFVPVAQALHWLIMHPGMRKHRSIKSWWKEPMVRSLVISAAVIAPWVWKVVREATRLKQAWYFPVNINLVMSVLGNMFVGYEGTPWYGWKYTAILSVLLLGLFLLAVANRQKRERNLLFMLMVFTPLTLVIGVSFVKPLFVNRYLIPVTVAQVFLVIAALEAIRNKLLQKFTASAFLLFLIGFNVWYPTQHAKLDIRTPISQINALMGQQDVIFAETPLIFFESIYYSRDRSRVFLYNPNNVAFPWYVGDIIVSEGQMALDIPTYPMRAFLVHEDGSFSISYRAPLTPENLR